jgi:hypothetical protein
MFKSEELEKKWQPILESAEAPAFVDNYRKSVTAVLLENQEIAARESAAQANFLSEESNLTGAVAKWDPVLVSLVRRAMPSLVAYDIAGVQPMTGPTGLIFAMKARYASNNDSPQGGANTISTGDPEALFDTIDDDFSGQTGDSPNTIGTGMPTATGETAEPANMGFTIEKQTVTANTRQLQAEYSMELAQDLKAVHGLDAEAELANILSTEILAEINREVIGRINHEAQKGAPEAATPGTFDLDGDADGRWAVEKFKSLLFQAEIEANEIAKGTRRGKGNYILCSSNVASALAAAGVLDYSPALSTDLNVDDTGNTFAGVINGRMKVYIDPYEAGDYLTVGYKGSSAYDAGIFYCPYVPLTMVRAVAEDTFQPKIGFKTRYGLVSNPLVAVDGTAGLNTNPYFRRFLVSSINDLS